MSLVTDVLAAVFTVTGVSSVTNAFNTIYAAQEKLAKAQARFDAGPASDKLKKGLKDAEEAAEKAGSALLGSFIRPTIAGMAALASAMRDATEEYTKFAQTAMNLRDLTGVSGGAAARQLTIFRAAGINDMQSQREILKLSRDTMTPKGHAVLQSIGVDPKGATTGIALLNEVADGFNRMGAGVDKAGKLSEAFGTRLVTSMLPYLQLSKEVRNELGDLSTVTDANLQGVKQWQIANMLLGASWEQGVVFPMMALVLPALTQLVGGITKVVHIMGEMNKATHGLAGFVGVLVLMEVGILALIVAWKAYNVTARLVAGWNAIIAAFSGNWAALAAGIAVAAAVGLTVVGFSAWEQAHPERAAAGNAAALDRNTAALDNVADNMGSMNRGGIPEGLNRFDVQQLSHQRALGAIG